MSEGPQLRREPGRLGAVVTRSRTIAAVPARPRSAEAPTSFGHHAALDGLRALAVLVIIAFHDEYSWAKGGFLGVDLFFVLSGFLITTLLVTEWNRTGGIALRRFWARRVRRLLPALLVVLAGVAAFTRFQVLPWNRTGVRDDALASLAYVSNWRSIGAKQGYFELFTAPSPLRHMWSLAVEEQFYVVWPVVVVVLLRLGRRSLKPLVFATAAGTVGSIVAMAWAFDRGQGLRAYYGTDTRVHTILLDALLALVHLHWRDGRRARRWLAWSGLPALVLVGIMMVTSTGGSWRYYHGGSVVFALLAALVVTAAMEPGVLRSVLQVRPLAWVGRLSYGLYLFHWPIIVWMVPSRFDLAPSTLNLARLGVTFAVAIASYHLVEMPVRERRLLGVRPPRRMSLPKRSLVVASTRRDISRWIALPALALTLAVVAVSTTGASAPPAYLGQSRPTAQPAYLGSDQTLPPASPPSGASTGSTGSAATPTSTPGSTTPVPAPESTYAERDRPQLDKSIFYRLGDPGFCGPPRTGDARQAEQTAARLGAPRVARSAAGMRVLMLGDSTACAPLPRPRCGGRPGGGHRRPGHRVRLRDDHRPDHQRSRRPAHPAGRTLSSHGPPGPGGGHPLLPPRPHRLDEHLGEGRPHHRWQDLRDGHAGRRCRHVARDGQDPGPHHPRRPEGRLHHGGGPLTQRGRPERDPARDRRRQRPKVEHDRTSLRSAPPRPGDPRRPRTAHLSRRASVSDRGGVGCSCGRTAATSPPRPPPSKPAGSCPASCAPLADRRSARARTSRHAPGTTTISRCRRRRWWPIQPRGPSQPTPPTGSRGSTGTGQERSCVQGCPVGRCSSPRSP